MDPVVVGVALLLIGGLALVGSAAAVTALGWSIRDRAVEQEIARVALPAVAPVRLSCACPRCAGLPCDRSWGRA